LESVSEGNILLVVSLYVFYLKLSRASANPQAAESTEDPGSKPFHLVPRPRLTSSQKAPPATSLYPRLVPFSSPAPRSDELTESNKHNVRFRIRHILFRLPSPSLDIRYEPSERRLENYIGIGMCPAFVAALLPIEDARGESPYLFWWRG
jgi:hypothetical protein